MLQTDLTFIHVLNVCVCVITVVDEADGGDSMKTGAHFSSFDLFKTIRQTVEKILPLLVETEPQIQLQLSLNRPASRTEPFLTGKL